MQAIGYTQRIKCLFSAPVFNNRPSMIPHMRLALITIAACSAALPTIVAAQEPARDFTLPPSETPTPAPTPTQGPVDDAGPVPVGPRPIVPETQPVRPQPEEDNEPVTEPVAPPGSAGEPVPQQTDNSARPLPAQSPLPRPGLPPSPSAGAALAPENPAIAIPGAEATTTTEPAPSLTAEPSAGPITSIPVPQSVPDNGAGQAIAEPAPLWLWIAGGLAALLAILAAVFVALRGRASSARVPTIEPPVVAPASQSATIAEKGIFTLELRVENVMRSMMMVSVKAQVMVANRSDRALRDLEICGDLISASRTVPMDQQLACGDMALAPLTTIERIGPHQSRNVSINVQMPVAQIDVLQQAGVPMFVPLLRLCGHGETADPLAKTFVLGIGAAGTKLHPLPLDGAPGGYQGVAAKPVG